MARSAKGFAKPTPNQGVVARRKNKHKRSAAHSPLPTVFFFAIL